MEVLLASLLSCVNLQLFLSCVKPQIDDNINLKASYNLEQKRDTKSFFGGCFYP